MSRLWVAQTKKIVINYYGSILLQIMNFVNRRKLQIIFRIDKKYLLDKGLLISSPNPSPTNHRHHYQDTQH